jgi:predicted transcriptional regulator
MDRREKIDLIIEILKNEGMLQSNHLVNRIVDDGIMARQTAYDTIDEAVKAGKIIRKEEMKGKQKVVFYSVHTNINETEKFFLDEMEKLLSQFDQKFCFFKNELPTLSIKEKAYSFELFSLFLSHLTTTVRQLWINFGKTRKWSIIKNGVQDSHAQMDKLLNLESKKEQGVIGWHIIEGRIWYLNDTIKNFDGYFNEIKKSK